MVHGSSRSKECGKICILFVSGQASGKVLWDLVPPPCLTPVNRKEFWYEYTICKLKIHILENTSLNQRRLLVSQWKVNTWFLAVLLMLGDSRTHCSSAGTVCGLLRGLGHSILNWRRPWATRCFDQGAGEDDLLNYSIRSGLDLDSSILLSEGSCA